ncbi:unnamed protein product [Dicrocoelium dendriticum]|nr:unnamed protein product [Dicrocoelium dendriticum]
MLDDTAECSKNEVGCSCINNLPSPEVCSSNDFPAALDLSLKSSEGQSIRSPDATVQGDKSGSFSQCWIQDFASKQKSSRITMQILEQPVPPSQPLWTFPPVIPTPDQLLRFPSRIDIPLSNCLPHEPGVHSFKREPDNYSSINPYANPVQLTSAIISPTHTSEICMVPLSLEASSPNDTLRLPQNGSMQSHSKITPSTADVHGHAPLNYEKGAFRSGVHQTSNIITCPQSPTQCSKPRQYRKARAYFQPQHMQCLEEFFRRNPYLCTRDREMLAEKLNLSEARIRTWFQNRRMREKRNPNRFRLLQ